MREGRTRAVARLRAAVPVQPFARALLLRGVFLWFGVRCTLLAVAISPFVAIPQAVFATMPGRSWGGVFPSLRTVLFVLAGVGVLALLEARRRNEIVLLANLGVGRSAIVVLSVLPAAALELLLALIPQLVSIPGS